MKFGALVIASAIAFLPAALAPAAAQPLAVAAPDKVGLSKEKLANIGKALAADVEREFRRLKMADSSFEVGRQKAGGIAANWTLVAISHKLPWIKRA